jgi:hypothetical protein
MVRYLCDSSDDQLRRIGCAAQQRVLAEHTSEIRAREFESAVEGKITASETINFSSPLIAL